MSSLESLTGTYKPPSQKLMSRFREVAYLMVNAGGKGSGMAIWIYKKVD